MRTKAMGKTIISKLVMMNSTNVFLEEKVRLSLNSGSVTLGKAFLVGGMFYLTCCLIFIISSLINITIIMINQSMNIYYSLLRLGSNLILDILSYLIFEFKYFFSFLVLSNVYWMLFSMLSNSLLVSSVYLIIYFISLNLYLGVLYSYLSSYKLELSNMSLRVHLLGVIVEDI